MRYPKTLIIGQSFTKNTGGGITLSNLFSGWPSDRIASVSFQKNEDWTICRLQYLLGNMENNKSWPFCILQDIQPSQIINHLQNPEIYEENDSQLLLASNNTLSLRIFLRRNIKSFLKFLGLFFFLQRIKISDKLTAFIEDFSPEIIYSQLADHVIIQLVDKVSDRFNLPIAVHIMDDWPVIIHREGLLGNYLNRITHNAFKKIVAKSALCLAISDSMGEEYKKRYKRNWNTFHNPINPSIWKQQPDAENYHRINQLVYFGRIGRANLHSLLLVLDASKQIKKRIEDFEFHIFTPDYKLDILKKYQEENYIRIFPPVKHHQVPTTISNARLLILPLDFNKDSRKFAQFSMPTKATEYMASGIPVIVFAPPGNAVTQYAKKEGWGYVIEEPNKELIVNAIIDLLSNQTLRNKLSFKALNIVMEYHDEINVRQRFKETLATYSKH